MSVHTDPMDTSDLENRDVQESIEAKYAAVEVEVEVEVEEEESAAFNVEAEGASIHNSAVEPVSVDADPHAMSSMRALANGQVDRVVKATLSRIASTTTSTSTATGAASDGQSGTGSALHLTRDGRVALHKAATVFLLFLGTLVEEEKRAAAEEAALLAAHSGRGKRSGGGNALEGAARAPPKRLTINVQDIKAALHTAGMGAIAEQLQSKRTRQ